MWNFDAVIIYSVFLLWCVAACTVMLEGRSFRTLDTVLLLFDLWLFSDSHL
jgi:hypothetical protein